MLRLRDLDRTKAWVVEDQVLAGLAASLTEVAVSKELSCPIRATQRVVENKLNSGDEKERSPCSDGGSVNESRGRGMCEAPKGG